jgi:hypothetical protein
MAPHGIDHLPEVGGIIGAVSHDDLGAVSVDQGGRLRHIALVPAGQAEGDRVAQPSYS